MKTLEFFFQETQIHFLLQNEGNVMVNATEMAKAFNKRIDVFLKTEPTKLFIETLKFPPVGVNLDIKSDEDIIQTRGRNGTYFHRVLALKFAAWLDPNFEVWVYSTIDNLLFGNYKKHWEAHAAKEIAEQRMEVLKKELLEAPTPSLALAYFEA